MSQLFNRPCDCFDFAISWDFFRAHCWEVHGYDPGPNEMPKTVQPQEQVIVHRHSDMSKQESEELRQKRLMVDYLKERLAERRKKGSDYEPF